MDITATFKELNLSHKHLIEILRINTNHRRLGISANIVEKILNRRRNGRLAPDYECYRIEGNAIYFGTKLIWSTGGIRIRNFVDDVQRGCDFQHKNNPEFHSYFFPKTPNPFLNEK